MRIWKNGRLALALVLLPACGGQLVEFSDASMDGPGTDVANTGGHGGGGAAGHGGAGGMVTGGAGGMATGGSGGAATGGSGGGVSGNGGRGGGGAAGIGLGGSGGLGGVPGLGGQVGVGGAVGTGGLGGRGGIGGAGLGGAGGTRAAGGRGGVGAAGGRAGAGGVGGVGGAGGSLGLVILFTSPGNNATAAITTVVRVTFNEALNGSTLTSSTFILKQGATTIAGQLSYIAGSTVFTFTPTVALTLGLPYTATVTTGLRDLAGNGLPIDRVWNFTTAACGQATVVLGAAANFVALAGSTVTNTGPTAITGDLGVSPGTAVTGFPPGTVVGAQHAGDATAALAEGNLTTAYNDAAGRTLCPVSVAGNLGGQTLAPGLYKSTGSLEISAGDLTLDAQGDSTAVFIFQMASTLTTTSGRQVVLAGMAKSTNVFWQVGTSATFGSTSAFQGTVMADQAITMDTGATLNGRLLARIAGVALDSNMITKPAP